MNPISEQATGVVATENAFLKRVYMWMSAGLAVSAVVSFFLLNNPSLLKAYFSSPLSFILPIGELILVFWMFSKIHTFNQSKATGLYFFYAALNGVTLTPLLIQYTSASIFSTFCVTGATFFVTSLYGYGTNKDLSSMGSYLFMGMIGIIIASLINLFLQSPAIYWILTYAGVGLSVAVTAYYGQAIRKMSQGYYEGHPMQSQGAILGALMLYVAFVMMFVYLLRILGNRR